MKQLSLFLICAFAFAFARAQQQPAPPPQQSAIQKQPSPANFPDSSTYKNAVITYSIIGSPCNTFGYDVFVNGKLMIHQTSIPAMPGNEGFKTQNDAAKVADMMMYKIRKGEMPPTVSIEELKQLSVIK